MWDSTDSFGWGAGCSYLWQKDVWYIWFSLRNAMWEGPWMWFWHIGFRISENIFSGGRRSSRDVYVYTFEAKIFRMWCGMISILSYLFWYVFGSLWKTFISRMVAKRLLYFDTFAWGNAKMFLDIVCRQCFSKFQFSLILEGVSDIFISTSTSRDRRAEVKFSKANDIE